MAGAHPIVSPNDDWARFRCDTCGLYEMTPILAAMFRTPETYSREERAVVSGATRRASGRGEVLALSTANVRELLGDVPLESSSNQFSPRNPLAKSEPSPAALKVGVFRVNDEVLVTGVLHREEREQHGSPAAPREMIGRIVEARPAEFLYLVYFFDGTDNFDGWYPEASLRFTGRPNHIDLFLLWDLKNDTWAIWFMGPWEREVWVTAIARVKEKRPPTPEALENARRPGIVIHAFERSEVAQGRRPVSVVFTDYESRRRVIPLEVTKRERMKDGEGLIYHGDAGSRPTYHGDALIEEAYFDEVFRTSAGSITLFDEEGEVGEWEIDWRKK